MLYNKGFELRCEVEETYNYSINRLSIIYNNESNLNKDYYR